MVSFFRGSAPPETAVSKPSLNFIFKLSEQIFLALNDSVSVLMMVFVNLSIFMRAVSMGFSSVGEIIGSYSASVERPLNLDDF